MTLAAAPFTVDDHATEEDIRLLAADVSPMEMRTEAARRCYSDPEWIRAAASICRTYAVRIGGRLAATGLVADTEERRELMMILTGWLTEHHALDYARALPGLFAVLARFEHDAGRDDRPCVFRATDLGRRGDGRGRNDRFFRKCGCTVLPGGEYRCPDLREIGAEKERRCQDGE